MEDYNRRQALWAQRIRDEGGRRQTNSRIWFAGGVLPDDSLEEYLSFPITAQPSSVSHPYTFALTDVDAISDPLGIPWEISKEIDFCSCPEYFGFYWHIDRRAVGLPDKKKKKYRAAIDLWRLSNTHDLQSTQKIYGKLIHACHVLPSGRVYITSLEYFMSLFGNSPSIPRKPPRIVASDLNWWYERLSRFVLERPDSQLLDIQAFSDASSSVGIGIVINGAWRAWTLLPGWQRDKRTIEPSAQKSSQDALEPSTHIKIYCDNKVVVDGWRIGRSRNEQVNSVFKRLHQLCEDHNCFLHIRYVQSKCNPADNPSTEVCTQKDLCSLSLISPMKLSNSYASLRMKKLLTHSKFLTRSRFLN